LVPTPILVDSSRDAKEFGLCKIVNLRDKVKAVLIFHRWMWYAVNVAPEGKEKLVKPSSGKSHIQI
jgi:hypothetical protein